MNREGGPVKRGPPKVFVCYRREETAAHAGRIYDAMVARFGAGNVFMDVDLAPGVDFVERITEVVSACQVLIVVMGPNWATVEDEEGNPRVGDPNDFVRLEVEAGLRRPEVTSIPVLVAGARMPRREDLPEGVRAITRRNALELSEARWRYDVGRLNDRLDELLAGFPVAGREERAHEALPVAADETPSGAGSSRGSRAEKATPAPRGRRRGLRWALLGALALAALAVAVVIATGGGGGACSLGQVRCVIERAAKPTAPADCTRLETQAYLEQATFEDGAEAIAKCRRNALNTRNDPDSVEVADVEESGAGATARVSINGGFYDGQTQVVALVKRGDQWKLNRIQRFEDFDMRRYIEAFQRTAPFDDEPLTEKKAVCVAGQLGRFVAPDQLEAAILAANKKPFGRAYRACDA